MSRHFQLPKKFQLTSNLRYKNLEEEDVDIELEEVGEQTSSLKEEELSSQRDVATKWDQFKAIMLKNYILKSRSKKLTLVEILFPLYFGSILILLSSATGPQHIAAALNQDFEAVPAFCDAIASYNSNNGENIPCSLGFAPTNDPLAPQVMSVFSLLNPSATISSYSSTADLLGLYRSQPEALIGGIFFNNTNPPYIQEPTYTISLNQSIATWKNNLVYLAVQKSLHASVLVSNLNITPTLDYQLSEFPIREQTILNQVGEYFFLIYFPLFFIPSITHLVTMIVTEKEKKLKEGMKMMGLNEVVYWGSWFVTQFAVVFLSIVLFLVMAYIFGLFIHSNPIIIFFGLIFYAASTITFAFIVTVFVDSPKTGNIIAFLVLMLMTLMLYAFHFAVIPSGSILWTIIFSLLTPVPFGEFAFSIGFYETHGSGVGFSNIVSTETGYPVLLAFFFMILDTVLYGALAWYLGNVLPGEYGTSKGPVFFLSPEYWSSSPTATNSTDSSASTILLQSQESELTDSSNQKEVGIAVKGLKKIYSKGLCSKEEVIAVNNIDLEMFKGEIFALLGHNGAGKSSTIGMLTGLFPATEGRMTIHGYDVETQIDEIRNFLGVCPQHDILFDDLTGEEHLVFYAAIKGVRKEAIAKQVAHYIEAVGLTASEAQRLSKDLSGGMKRKLSIAIALIGGSQVIFLDECTAGLDPLSRRKIWKLLQSIKKDKTIVMTTHSMEEADLLGNRIAIVKKGVVSVVGTSVSLKKQFGLGYHLTFSKEEDCNEKTLTKFIHKFIPNAEMLNSSAMEIAYRLPYGSNFPEFFFNLEKS